jgi:hypothetical protein
MPDLPDNKYRHAMEILQRGRELMVEDLADELLDQRDDLIEGGFRFHEFLESHGTRLHFLSLILCHLEQSAEAVDEQRAHSEQPPPSPPKSPATTKRRRSRPRGSRASTPLGKTPPESDDQLDDIPF